jgi:hypothetical protein
MNKLIIRYILNKLRLLKWKILDVDVKNNLSKETERETGLLLLRKIVPGLNKNEEYTFIDCGANNGLYSQFVSSLDSGKFYIYAFEPCADI